MEPEDLDFLYGVENDDRLWNVGVTNVPYSKVCFWTILHQQLAIFLQTSRCG